MFWRKFPKHKPPKKGWYICTVEVPHQQRYVMNLYWYPDRQKFIDNCRQSVFEIYDVYGYVGKAGELKKEKLYTSSDCDRTEDVVAWMKMPKTYMKGFVKHGIDYYQ